MGTVTGSSESTSDRRGLDRLFRFELLLMFEAVRRPGHRLQALFLNRLAVNQTRAKGPRLDAVERVVDQVEGGGVGLGAGELLVLQFV